MNTNQFVPMRHLDRFDNVGNIFKLIRLYRANECLWNPKSVGYNNLALKENAWARMASLFQDEFTVVQLKLQIRSLLIYYLTESEAIKRCAMVGDEYVPRHSYFYELNFLSINKYILLEMSLNTISNSDEALTETHEKRNALQTGKDLPDAIKTPESIADDWLSGKALQCDFSHVGHDKLLAAKSLAANYRADCEISKNHRKASGSELQEFDRGFDRKYKLYGLGINDYGNYNPNGEPRFYREPPNNSKENDPTLFSNARVERKKVPFIIIDSAKVKPRQENKNNGCNCDVDNSKNMQQRTRSSMQNQNYTEPLGNTLTQATRNESRGLNAKPNGNGKERFYNDKSNKCNRSQKRPGNQLIEPTQRFSNDFEQSTDENQCYGNAQCRINSTNLQRGKLENSMAPRIQQRQNIVPAQYQPDLREFDDTPFYEALYGEPYYSEDSRQQFYTNFDQPSTGYQCGNCEYEQDSYRGYDNGEDFAQMWERGQTTKTNPQFSNHPKMDGINKLKYGNHNPNFDSDDPPIMSNCMCEGKIEINSPSDRLKFENFTSNPLTRQFKQQPVERSQPRNYVERCNDDCEFINGGLCTCKLRALKEQNRWQKDKIKRNLQQSNIDKSNQYAAVQPQNISPRKLSLSYENGRPDSMAMQEQYECECQKKDFIKLKAQEELLKRRQNQMLVNSNGPNLVIPKMQNRNRLMIQCDNKSGAQRNDKMNSQMNNRGRSAVECEHVSNEDGNIVILKQKNVAQKVPSEAIEPFLLLPEQQNPVFESCSCETDELIKILPNSAYDISEEEKRNPQIPRWRNQQNGGLGYNRTYENQARGNMNRQKPFARLKNEDDGNETCTCGMDCPEKNNCESTKLSKRKQGQNSDYRKNQFMEKNFQSDGPRGRTNNFISRRRNNFNEFDGPKNQNQVSRKMQGRMQRRTPRESEDSGQFESNRSYEEGNEFNFNRRSKELESDEDGVADNCYCELQQMSPRTKNTMMARQFQNTQPTQQARLSQQGKPCGPCQNEEFDKRTRGYKKNYNQANMERTYQSAKKYHSEESEQSQNFDRSKKKTATCGCGPDFHCDECTCVLRETSESETPLYTDSNRKKANKEQALPCVKQCNDRSKSAPKNLNQNQNISSLKKNNVACGCAVDFNCDECVCFLERSLQSKQMPNETEESMGETMEEMSTCENPDQCTNDVDSNEESESVVVAVIVENGKRKENRLKDSPDCSCQQNKVMVSKKSKRTDNCVCHSDEDCSDCSCSDDNMHQKDNNIKDGDKNTIIDQNDESIENRLKDSPDRSSNEDKVMDSKSPKRTEKCVCDSDEDCSDCSCSDDNMHQKDNNIKDGDKDTIIDQNDESIENRPKDSPEDKVMDSKNPKRTDKCVCDSDEDCSQCSCSDDNIHGEEEEGNGDEKVRGGNKNKRTVNCVCDPEEDCEYCSCDNESEEEKDPTNQTKNILDANENRKGVRNSCDLNGECDDYETEKNIQTKALQFKKRNGNGTCDPQEECLDCSYNQEGIQTETAKRQRTNYCACDYEEDCLACSYEDQTEPKVNNTQERTVYCICNPSERCLDCSCANENGEQGQKNKGRTIYCICDHGEECQDCSCNNESVQKENKNKRAAHCVCKPDEECMNECSCSKGTMEQSPVPNKMRRTYCAFDPNQGCLADCHRDKHNIQVGHKYIKKPSCVCDSDEKCFDCTCSDEKPKRGPTNRMRGAYCTCDPDVECLDCSCGKENTKQCPTNRKRAVYCTCDQDIECLDCSCGEKNVIQGPINTQRGVYCTCDPDVECLDCSCGENNKNIVTVNRIRGFSCTCDPDDECLDCTCGEQNTERRPVKGKRSIYCTCDPNEECLDCSCDKDYIKQGPVTRARGFYCACDPEIECAYCTCDDKILDYGNTNDSDAQLLECTCNIKRTQNKRKEGADAIDNAYGKCLTMNNCLQTLKLDLLKRTRGIECECDPSKQCEYCICDVIKKLKDTSFDRKKYSHDDYDNRKDHLSDFPSQYTERNFTERGSQQNQCASSTCGKNGKDDVYNTDLEQNRLDSSIGSSKDATGILKQLTDTESMPEFPKSSGVAKEQTDSFSSDKQLTEMTNDRNFEEIMIQNKDDEDKLKRTGSDELAKPKKPDDIETERSLIDAESSIQTNFKEEQVETLDKTPSETIPKDFEQDTKIKEVSDSEQRQTDSKYHEAEKQQELFKELEPGNDKKEKRRSSFSPDAVSEDKNDRKSKELEPEDFKDNITNQMPRDSSSSNRTTKEQMPKEPKEQKREYSKNDEAEIRQSEKMEPVRAMEQNRLDSSIGSSRDKAEKLKQLTDTESGPEFPKSIGTEKEHTDSFSSDKRLKEMSNDKKLEEIKTQNEVNADDHKQISSSSSGRSSKKLERSDELAKPEKSDKIVSDMEAKRSLSEEQMETDKIASKAIPKDFVQDTKIKELNDSEQRRTDSKYHEAEKELEPANDKKEKRRDSSTPDAVSKDKNDKKLKELKDVEQKPDDFKERMIREMPRDNSSSNRTNKEQIPKELEEQKPAYSKNEKAEMKLQEEKAKEFKPVTDLEPKRVNSSNRNARDRAAKEKQNIDRRGSDAKTQEQLVPESSSRSKFDNKIQESKEKTKELNDKEEKREIPKSSMVEKKQHAPDKSVKEVADTEQKRKDPKDNKIEDKMREEIKDVANKIFPKRHKLAQDGRVLEGDEEKKIETLGSDEQKKPDEIVKQSVNGAETNTKEEKQMEISDIPSQIEDDEFCSDGCRVENEQQELPSTSPTGVTKDHSTMDSKQGEDSRNSPIRHSTYSEDSEYCSKSCGMNIRSADVMEGRRESDASKEQQKLLSSSSSRIKEENIENQESRRRQSSSPNRSGSTEIDKSHTDKNTLDHEKEKRLHKICAEKLICIVKKCVPGLKSTDVKQEKSKSEPIIQQQIDSASKTKYDDESQESKKQNKDWTDESAMVQRDSFSSDRQSKEKTGIEQNPTDLMDEDIHSQSSCCIDNVFEPIKREIRSSEDGLGKEADTPSQKGDDEFCSGSCAMNFYNERKVDNEPQQLFSANSSRLTKGNDIQEVGFSTDVDGKFDFDDSVTHFKNVNHIKEDPSASSSRLTKDSKQGEAFRNSPIGYSTYSNGTDYCSKSCGMNFFNADVIEESTSTELDKRRTDKSVTDHNKVKRLVEISDIKRESPPACAEKLICEVKKSVTGLKNVDVQQGSRRIDGKIQQQQQQQLDYASSGRFNYDNEIRRSKRIESSTYNQIARGDVAQFYPNNRLPDQKMDKTSTEISEFPIRGSTVIAEKSCCSDKKFSLQNAGVKKYSDKEAKIHRSDITLNNNIYKSIKSDSDNQDVALPNKVYIIEDEQGSESVEKKTSRSSIFCDCVSSYCACESSQTSYEKPNTTKDGNDSCYCDDSGRCNCAISTNCGCQYFTAFDDEDASTFRSKHDNMKYSTEEHHYNVGCQWGANLSTLYGLQDLQYAPECLPNDSSVDYVCRDNSHCPNSTLYGNQYHEPVPGKCPINIELDCTCSIQGIRQQNPVEEKSGQTEERSLSEGHETENKKPENHANSLKEASTNGLNKGRVKVGSPQFFAVKSQAFWVKKELNGKLLKFHHKLKLLEKRKRKKILKVKDDDIENVTDQVKFKPDIDSTQQEADYLSKSSKILTCKCLADGFLSPNRSNNKLYHGWAQQIGRTLQRRFKKTKRNGKGIHQGLLHNKEPAANSRPSKNSVLQIKSADDVFLILPDLSLLKREPINQTNTK